MDTIGAILAVLAIGFCLDAVIAWIFKLLWNFVAAGVFGAPVLTFWPAFALILLISIVGSFFKSNSNK